MAPRAMEELHDPVADSHGSKNLIELPVYREQPVRMRAALTGCESETGHRPATLRTAGEFERVTGKPTAARRRPRWSQKQMVEAGLSAP